MISKITRKDDTKRKIEKIHKKLSKIGLEKIDKI